MCQNNLNCAKIYKIENENYDQVYIGSTTQKLNVRFSQHKSMRYSSRTLFETDGAKIVLLLEYPCKSKEDLENKEREYILENNCINKQVPHRTYKEYYQDKKEFINRKVTCKTCGCQIFKRCMNRHEKTKKHKKNLNNSNKKDERLDGFSQSVCQQKQDDIPTGNEGS